MSTKQWWTMKRQSAQRNPTALLPYLSQIPHGLTCDCTQAADLRSWQ